MLNNLIFFINTLLINFCLGFYLISALQWYSYKINRVLFHFAKPLWHIYFILIPLIAFWFLGKYFLIFAIFNLVALYLWYKKLDKKLVFTAKIKKFFAILSFLSIVFGILSLYNLYNLSPLALFFSLIILSAYEKYRNNLFYQQAKNKIQNMKDLKIILITASFGKTSIKNFLYELIKEDYKSYKTPRSVNTLMGIIQDINDNVQADTQIYIAEAGAREKGDILQITELLNPHICIIGEIGNAHLEYFKNIENTRNTKLEALNSNRLQKAFLHSSTLKEDSESQIIYDKKLLQSSQSLEGIEFELLLNDSKQHFKSPLLGIFNAQNLAACIQCALYLNINLEKIQQRISQLKAVEHRLQIISKEPKFIIDDGFNGNFQGMSQSYRLCKNYKGRKVLVTPGILEVSEEENQKLADIINECFDFVIITSQSNTNVLDRHIVLEKIIIKDKTELVSVLSKYTKNGDLILFSNDAPSFL
ncbi:UDP-N-acetylmuramoyl-tripeptide--D-alanyl-D-alanine ligase [Campylobacter sp. CCS1377]|uniref:UDP-N-acetylmuramoyl-tripeptide--D-alanyl-D-alanine ligase n=1 Tax=Campylobacter sp. CCS1377 TaxID=3158229 RepID=A0AAU7E660_9BACT